MRLSFGIVAVLFVACAHAHICLLNPVQRGGFNVSDPGDLSCFQPTGPCGSTDPEQPRYNLIGGAGFTVLLQQNLNHYNPGWPGFIDVAWAKGANASDDDFITLATIPDYWPHLQAMQTNFSIPIVVPNVDCAHCTLRVRYHPNKPTEPIFHNCADISIVQSKAPIASTFGRIYALAQIGNVAELNYFVELHYNGTLTLASDAPISVRSSGITRDHLKKNNGRSVQNDLRAPSPRSVSALLSRDTGAMPPPHHSGRGGGTVPGLANGVLSVDPPRQRVYFVGYGEQQQAANVSANAVPSYLVTYDIATRSFLSPTALSVPDPYGQWSALVSNFGSNSAPAYAVEFIQDEEAGEYRFLVRAVGTDGAVSSPFGNFPSDPTFVNYFWAEFDHARNKLYLLAGDENSLYRLNVRLYTLDTTTGKVSYVSVANDRYTLASVHVDARTGLLYALSPGLFPQAKYNWTLVLVDPATGNVKPVSPDRSPVVVPSSAGDPYGDLAPYYGGGMYGTAVATDGYLLHLFKRTSDGSSLLAVIDLERGHLQRATVIDTGVNNQIALSSLVYIPPPPSAAGRLAFNERRRNG